MCNMGPRLVLPQNRKRRRQCRKKTLLNLLLEMAVYLFIYFICHIYFTSTVQVARSAQLETCRQLTINYDFTVANNQRIKRSYGYSFPYTWMSMRLKLLIAIMDRNKTAQIITNLNRRLTYLLVSNRSKILRGKLFFPRALFMLGLT